MHCIRNSILALGLVVASPAQGTEDTCRVVSIKAATIAKIRVNTTGFVTLSCNDTTRREFYLKTSPVHFQDKSSNERFQNLQMQNLLASALLSGMPVKVEFSKDWLQSVTLSR